MIKKIAILTALQTEGDPVIMDFIQKKLETEVGSLKFYSGKLSSIKPKVYLGVFGIGKVQAAMATQFVIDRFSPDHIFLIGACGGVTKEVNPGDILIPNKTVQADFDTTCFGDEKGEFQGPTDDIKYKEFETDKRVIKFFKKNKVAKNIKLIKGKRPVIRYGSFVSQDKFETDKRQLEILEKEFRCIGFDMEAAAVNIVSSMNDIPFNMIKSVLDTGGELDMDFYNEYIKVVCGNSYQVLRAYLETF